MNQNNPETYALTARFPLDDAARFRALARSLGVTPSALAAKLVRSTARLLKLTPVEFAEAAARLNRPFATSHVR